MTQKNNIKITEAIRHIKKVDPVLHTAILKLPKPNIKARKRYFQSLVSSIISQQLSTKAADTIEKRFIKLFLGKKFPTPMDIQKISELKLRRCGLSAGKAKYIKGIAEAFTKKLVQPRQFKAMTDEEIIVELVKIKGIGRWTAEMFLMFSLARPDVFSHGDLGLKKAIQQLYKFKEIPTQKQVEKIVAKWSPYRTTASRYLWLSLDQK